nr:MAG TPA: DNA pilot protein VP2 [Microviridae sp.]
MAVGAILGGIGSVLGGIGSGIAARYNYKAQKETNATNLQLQREANQNNLAVNQMNNAFNAEQAQLQRDYNTEMWNQQNAYNTASAQRQRLEAAGLNPYIMMSGGSAGVASGGSGSTAAASAASAVPQQAARLQAPNLDMSGVQYALHNAMIGAGQVADSFASARNKESASKLADAQTGLVDLQLSTPDFFKSIVDARKANADYLRGKTDYWNFTPAAIKMQQDASGVQTQIKLESNRRQLDNLVNSGMLMRAQTASTLLDAQSKKILNQYLPQQQQADLLIKAANAFSLYHSGQLSMQRAQSEIANQLLISAKTTGQNLSNRIAQKTAYNIIQAMNMDAMAKEVEGYQRIKWAPRDAESRSNKLYWQWKNERRDYRMKPYKATLQGVNTVGNFLGNILPF